MLPALNGFSQKDSTSFERLLADSKRIYSLQLGTKNARFYDGLSEVSRFVLQANNPNFSAAGKELAKAKGLEDIYLILADSIYTRLNKEHIWKGHEEEYIKFKPVFELYLNKTCPYLTGKKVKPQDWKKFDQLFQEADSIAVKDTLLTTAIKAETVNFSQEELSRMLPLLMVYEYSNCEIVRQMINMSLKERVAANVSDYGYEMRYNLPRIAIKLFKENKLDSLKRVFPNYVSYKKEISNVIAFNQNASLEFSHRQNYDKAKLSAVEMIDTYYSSKPAVVIKGQVIYEMNVSDPLHPTLNRIKYIPAEQLTNKAELLKEIEADEVPPPPMEMIRQ